MDKLTREQRHKNMAAIHSANTKPEIFRPAVGMQLLP